MSTWEYRSIILYYDEVVDLEEDEFIIGQGYELNDFGQEGWELVSSIRRPDSATNYESLTLIFKRETTRIANVAPVIEI